MTNKKLNELNDSDLKGGTALSPRSQLVSDFFDQMNGQYLPWVVMNNYDGLPEVIPSDIDFSVPPELFCRLDEFIGDFAKKSNARLVQKLWHGNMKCAYILATGSEGTREFVQLDFFTAFSTKGAPALIAHEDLVSGRRALRNFHAPRPEIELLFTAMRRLFKNDWSDRHCARIAELGGHIVGTDWLPESYAWMHPTIEAASRGDVALVSARRAKDWAQLRKTARNNLSIRERIINAALQAKRLTARLRDETGQLIILAAPRDSLSNETLNALDLVFHRRVFVEAPSGVGLLAKLALLKRRKGLIFVLAGVNHPKGNYIAKRAARMGLADQIMQTPGLLDTGLDGLALPLVELTSDAVVIETILNIQAKKTDRAVARGGTQTSGRAK
jgi:hypothetical protein